MALHVITIVCVTAFCLLARWQVHRALSGNELSWAYAFEWPFFAGYAIYMWWRLLGDDERALPPPSDREREELEAYNRYLAGLAARDRRPGRRQP